MHVKITHQNHHHAMLPPQAKISESTHLQSHSQHSQEHQCSHRSEAQSPRAGKSEFQLNFFSDGHKKDLKSKLDHMKIKYISYFWNR